MESVSQNMSSLTVDDKIGKERSSKREKQVHVGNISFECTQRDLKEFLSASFGKVARCIFPRDKWTKKPKGYAFVIFEDKDSAQKAVCATGEQLILDGRYLRIGVVENSKQRRTKQIPSIANEFKCTYEEGGIEEEPAEDPHNIQCLNEDALIIIFSLLPIKDRIRLERVCQRWKLLLRCSWSVHKSLNFLGMFHRFACLTDQILKSILSRCGQYLVSLDVSASPRYLTQQSVLAMGNMCSSLTKLNLSNSTLQNKSMKILGTSCPRLKEIRLRDCRSIGEKGLWWLFHKCKELEYVDLHRIMTLTGQCFHMLGPNVVHMNLTWCSKLLDLGIIKIVERCPDLKTLNIEGCRNLTAVAMVHMSKRLRCLEVIDLSGPLEVSSETLQGLRSFPHLKKVNLSFNAMVTDATLEAMADGCPELECLNISGCNFPAVTNDGLMSLTRCPNLHTLDISYNRQIEDAPIMLLATCGRLKSLTARACTSITNEGIKALAVGCLELEEVDVSSCEQVSQELLDTFYEEYPESGSRSVTLILGGTSILPPESQPTSKVKINMVDRSSCHIRPDIIYLIDEPLMTEEDWDEYDMGNHLDALEFAMPDNNQDLNDLHDHALLGGDDDVYDDVADGELQDFLDFDDPQYEEDLQWS